MMKTFLTYYIARNIISQKIYRKASIRRIRNDICSKILYKNRKYKEACGGNSYYAFNIDPEVKAFVASLDKEKIGKIVNFGSAAMLNSTYKKVKEVADKAGIAMDEKEFHCKGEFKGIHKGRPNESDIAAVVQFAKQYK